MLCTLLRAVRVFFIGTALFSSKAIVHMDGQRAVAVTYQFTHQTLHIDQRSTWIQNQSYRECFDVLSIRPTLISPVMPLASLSPKSRRPTSSPLASALQTTSSPLAHESLKYEDHIKQVIDKKDNPFPVHDTEHPVPLWELHSSPRPLPSIRPVPSIRPLSRPLPRPSPTVPVSALTPPNTTTPAPVSPASSSMFTTSPPSPSPASNTTRTDTAMNTTRSRRPILAPLRDKSDLGHIQYAGNASSNGDNRVPSVIEQESEKEDSEQESDSEDEEDEYAYKN